MIYVLKHFDMPLIRFSAENGADSAVQLLWVNEAHKELLPLDLQQFVDAEHLDS